MAKISSKLYAEMLFQLCQEGKDIDSVLKNFVTVLAKHNKLSLLKKIIPDFVRLYNKKTATVDVGLETAFKLENKDCEPIISLAKSLAQAKNVEISQKINPGLIGGAIVNVDDWQIDLSLKNKLSKLLN